MDIVSLVVFVAAFAFCAVLVFWVSVVGSKERTFEEALEEKRRKLMSEKSNNRKSALNNNNNNNNAVKKDKDKKGKFAKKKAANQGEKKTEEDANSLGNNSVIPLKETKKTKKKNAKTTNVSRNVKNMHSQEIIEEEPISVQKQEPVYEAVVHPKVSEPVATSTVHQRKNKPKKKPMVIEEVREETVVVAAVATDREAPVPAVEEEAIQKTTAPSNAMPEAKKKAKDENVSSFKDNSSKDMTSKDNNKKNKLSVSQLLSIVKKTPMGDEECQHFIDILLNKQIGQESATGEWTSTSAPQKSVQKRLSEKEAELEEANAKVKSISDRLVILRQELNSSKVLSSNSTKIINEMKDKHEREKNNLQSQLQKQLDSRVTEINNLQGQITMQMSRNQQLESTINQLSTSKPAVDPQIYQELDQLRLAKEQYETQFRQMTTQIKNFNDEEEKLRAQLSNHAERTTEIERNHAEQIRQVNRGKAVLEEKVTVLEHSSGNNDALQGKIEELLRAKSDSDQTIAKLKRTVDGFNPSIKEKELEISRLADENERLSEQLASAVERPKAEGQEAGKQNGHDLNGHDEVKAKRAEETSWQNKYMTVVKDQENLVKTYDGTIYDLKEELKSAQTVITEVKNELDTQKNKNNELNAAISKVKLDSEESHKAFLIRLFPEARVESASKNHEDWLKKYEISFRQLREKPSEKFSEDVQKLEDKVSHYQKILSETEHMLNQLQASVESEEVGWKKRLNDKESELEELRNERNLLEKKNSAMDESLNVVKQAEEMQHKLQELQDKLTSEEVEKSQLQKKLAAVEEKLRSKDEIAKEIEQLKATLDAERKSKHELSEHVAKMDQLVTIGQEALQQEKKTVQLLRDQTVVKTENNTEAINVEVGGESKSTDKADSLSSASLDLSESSSVQQLHVKAKSKKKKK